MSYSISATRATRADLEAAIAEELAKVPVAQPVHEADINQAISAAKSLIDLMRNDPARDLYCSVSGSVWKKEEGVEQVSLNVSLNFTARKQ